MGLVGKLITYGIKNQKATCSKKEARSHKCAKANRGNRSRPGATNDPNGV